MESQGAAAANLNVPPTSSTKPLTDAHRIVLRKSLTRGCDKQAVFDKWVLEEGFEIGGVLEELAPYLSEQELEELERLKLQLAAANLKEPPPNGCARPLTDAHRKVMRKNLARGFDPQVVFDKCVLEQGFGIGDVLQELAPYLSSQEIERLDLQGSMEMAKKHRTNVGCQLLFCAGVKSTPHLEHLVQHANFGMEVPLGVLLAQKTHLNNEEIQVEACEALCALLGTNCFDNIFRLGGAGALTSFMQQDSISSNAKELLMLEICRNSESLDADISVAAFQKLFHAGFHKAVLHDMTAQPSNANINHSGATILKNVIPFFREEEKELLECTIKVLISAIDNFSLRGRDSKVPLRICSQIVDGSCWALHTMMKTHRGTKKLMGKAGAPLKMETMMVHCPNNAMIQASGSLVLRHFVGKMHLRYICLERAISAVLAHPNHTSVQKHAMLLFDSIHSRFYYGHGGKVEGKKCALFILKSGFVPHVLEIMERSTNMIVQTVGCMIVADLARWKETQQAVTSSEAVSCVARSLKLSQTKYKQWSGSSGFYNVVVHALDFLFYRMGTDTIVDSLMEEGGFQGAFAAMRHHVDHLERLEKFRVCKMLLRLASSKREDVKLEIACHCGAEAMLAAMKQNPDDQEIQRICCIALGELTTLKIPAIFEPIARADGVNIIMDAIEKFPYAKDKHIFNYGGSAALLVREFENEQKANRRRGNN